MDTNGGASPQVAEPTVIPAATPVVEASSLKKESGGSKTIADVNARIKAAMETAPAKAAEPAVEPAAPAETPVTEPVVETTPAEPEVAAEPEVELSEDEPVVDQGDGPVTAVKSRKLRMNLPEGDEVGRLAAAYQHRNRDWPLQQCLEAAQKQLGITPQTATAPAEPDKPKSGLPETVEAVDTAIESLEAERSKALIELRFEDVSAADLSLRRLDRQRMKLEKDGERQQVEQTNAYERGFASSDAKAIELYEFAGNLESPGSKRMLQIDADLKANGDPLYDSPDKPLRIAQMVAAELKIAPRRKDQPAPAKAAAPVAPAPKKQMLPGGGSSTTPPATQLSALDTKVQTMRARTMSEIRARDKALGLV
jgi:hypothetical protein